MANYAYVENDKILGIYDNLPKSWNNISNFNIITDWNLLNSMGWYKVTKIIPDYYDKSNYGLANPQYIWEDNTVYMTYELVQLDESILPRTSPIITVDDQWVVVRKLRDQLMTGFEWRYTRYNREVALGLPLSDDISAMNNYMQALADITSQEDPFSIIWPTYNP